MTGKQRAALRAQANGLKSIFQIGKQDIGDNLIEQINGALETRELIKLHVLETSGLSVREAAAEIAEATESEVIQVIGTRFVIYRESTTLPVDKRIELI